MHEGALGATTDNPWFGRCANPLDPARTPGGSSGGSGAAVAGHLVDASLGTDTLGSIRIPAAYCGVYGLKPTPGLVPRTGVVPLSWTLDTVGPLARDPATLAAMLRVLAGFDRDDPESRPSPDRWERGDAMAHDLKGLRFGIPRQIETVGIEPEVAAAFEAAVARAIAHGAEVRPVDIEGWSPGPLRRAGLLVAEAEVAAAIGPRIQAAAEGVSDGFRAALAFAGRQSAVRLAEAQAVMRGVGHAARGALSAVDALLMPTAPQRAFVHGGAVPVDQADLTALANIAGLPALSFPAGAAPDGLPAGVQLVGRPLADLRLAGWSALLADP
jgi:aspartyl-tRNA(Asn)/glutamyl-tRNA(Gln) amidotransferase subunit A